MQIRELLDSSKQMRAVHGRERQRIYLECLKTVELSQLAQKLLRIHAQTYSFTIAA